MTVELIPVIQIENFDPDIQMPEGPYWKHPEKWEEYNQANHEKVGFPDQLKSYLKGSSFYSISEISNNNLKKLVKDETEEMRKENYDRDLVSALSGGYILRVDNKDKIYPQCCSDLKTIYEWEELLDNQDSIFYNGHPAPLVTVEDDAIIFNLSLGEKYHEQFVPEPTQTIISVDKELLRHAIDRAKLELNNFSKRLLEIEKHENLNIGKIDKLLVWGDD